MRPGGGKPATPLEVAMFGHVAAAIRKAMDAKGWKPADLNRAIGRERGHSGVYGYINAKGAPVPAMRTVISKALGIPEAQLKRRRVDDDAPVEVATAEPRALALRTPQAGPTRPVLQFEVDGEGMARIRLDVALPSAQAVPLLRLLLDAGMIMGDR
jgi:hypothetical protein